MTAPTPPPLDLHDVLVARRDALLASVPGLDTLDVDLWEGGVRIGVGVAGQRVALKLRPRAGATDDEDEKAYSRTSSLLAALELPPDAPLARGTERVVLALLRWIERMDQGRLVVRKHAPDEVAPEPPPDAPAAAAAVVDDPVAIAPIALAELAAADWAGQRARLGGWHLVDTVLVLLGEGADAGGLAALVREARAAGAVRVAIGGPDVVAHPALEAVLEAARGAEVELEARPGDADALAGLAAAGVRAVVARADGDVAPLAHAAKAAGIAVIGWLPATADVLATLPARLDALAALGVLPRLAPPVVAGAAPDGNPLDLLPVDHLDVALVGQPVCFAAARPHLTAYLPTWRLLERGTRFGVVCKFCTAREGCPGVDPEHLERWRARGMVPLLDV